MCRLLGYLGPPVLLETLIAQPEHSLIVQSYQPREMRSGLLNADGFGVGWYHPSKEINPCSYRNILPIWSDPNLDALSRYIESGCVLANVRSATIGQAVQLSNCQPFQSGQILGVHNGFIENFRQTLYRPIRASLSDTRYQAIAGTTDSEHIFALIVNEQEQNPELSLAQALQISLQKLLAGARALNIAVGLNLILSDGHSLIASRCAYPSPAPSLYWLQNSAAFPGSVLLASEPVFTHDHWIKCPENSVVVFGEDLDFQIYPVPDESGFISSGVRSPQTNPSATTEPNPYSHPISL